MVIQFVVFFMVVEYRVESNKKRDINMGENNFMFFVERYLFD